MWIAPEKVTKLVGKTTKMVQSQQMTKVQEVRFHLAESLIADPLLDINIQWGFLSTTLSIWFSQSQFSWDAICVLGCCRDPTAESEKLFVGPIQNIRPPFPNSRKVLGWKHRSRAFWGSKSSLRSALVWCHCCEPSLACGRCEECEKPPRVNGGRSLLLAENLSLRENEIKVEGGPLQCSNKLSQEMTWVGIKMAPNMASWSLKG